MGQAPFTKTTVEYGVYPRIGDPVEETEAPQREQGDLTDNDYFKMGAAVAVGELFDSGKLGKREEVAADIRRFLESFGLHSLDDIRDLGIRGLYLADLEGVYAR